MAHKSDRLAWLLMTFLLLGCTVQQPAAPTAGNQAAPPTEPAPAATYIDVHMHLHSPAQGDGGDYEAAAGNLMTILDAHGLTGALIMPPPQAPNQRGGYTYEQLAVLTGDGRFNGRLHFAAGGGTLNPLIVGTPAEAVTPAVRAQFEEAAQKLVADGAVAFGEMAALHLCLSPTHHYIAAPADHPLFLLLADLSAQTGRPIDLHMEAVVAEAPMPANLAQACPQNPAMLPATIPALERLLSHNREAVIVWQHIGWDNTGQMNVTLLRRLLADHPNLYLALKVEERLMMVGDGGPMPNRPLDTGGQLASDWRQLIIDYPDRFVIGADEFIGPAGQTTPGVPSFTQSWRILDDLPADIVRQIGRDNVIRLYHLPE